MAYEPAEKLAPFSPLLLADRLITMAQDADRAGYRTLAISLLEQVDTVLDCPPVETAPAHGYLSFDRRGTPGRGAARPWNKRSASGPRSAIHTVTCR